MKRKIFFAVMLGAVLMIVNSCTKESQDALVDTIFPDKMSATINDTAWTSVTRATTKQLNRFIINGVSTSGKTLNITINGSAKGTYNLNINVLTDTLSANMSAFYKRSATTSINDIYYASRGSVTLSDVNTTDKVISGTFNMTMFKADTDNAFIKTDSVIVESGVFDGIKYIENN